MSKAWVIVVGSYEQAGPHEVALTWEGAQRAAQRYHETSSVLIGGPRRLHHDWAPDKQPDGSEWQYIDCAGVPAFDLDDCELGMQLVPLEPG